MFLLEKLAPYKFLVEAAVVGFLLISFAEWWHQHNMAQQKMGYDKAVAEYTVKLNEAKDQAAKDQAAMQAQIDAAVTEREAREQIIRNLATASSTSANSLRDAVANISRGVPTATVEALRNSTTALAAVFTVCQEEYRGLAEKADRHASDAKTLSDAWPTKKEPDK